MGATAYINGTPRTRAQSRPRKRSKARNDLGIAAAIVAFSMVLDTPGVAVAALLSILFMAVRIAVGVQRARVRRRMLAKASARAARSGREVPGARPRRRGGPTGAQRTLRVATVAALLTLFVASISFTSALSARSDSSVGIRAVEWLRDNGAAGLVSQVEAYWYTFNAPDKGGPGLKRLPSAGVAGAATVAGYRPPSIQPVLNPPLAGEGVWHPTQSRFANSGAPVLVTTYRPDRDYPRVVAGVAWINPRQTTISLQPGIQEPPGGGSRGAAEVPQSQRGNLLATFNSGFKNSDSGGGFYSGGQLFQPLVKGQGTIIGTRNGQVDVRTWDGGPRPGPDVTFARQNLPLIVDGGRPNPNLSDGPLWGKTLGNAVLVWRSGVGVDSHGNLIYAAANFQSVKGLADILMRAGAVRAVQLDINSYWVSFNSYAGPGAVGPSKLLPDIARPAGRYLSPDDRDFFAVYSR